MEGEQAVFATQLLVSQLCHDLISPIGAVNNGMELIEESADPELGREAMALIGASGRAAEIKLRFFRMAYGSAGRGAGFDLGDARLLAEEFLAVGGRVQLDWAESPALEAAVAPPGSGQLVLSLIPLAVSLLPRRGTIAIELGGEGEALLTLRASGPGARSLPALEAAIRDARLEVALDTVHAWFFGRLLERLGGTLDFQPAVDQVTLQLDLRRQRKPRGEGAAMPLRSRVEAFD